jgi:hypothetical protein
MASQQITDFGYEIFLTPKSATGTNKVSIFTGITVHSPLDDVTAEVAQFCNKQGLNASEYQVHKDLTIY